MNGKVLDIQGGDSGDGANVITYDQKDDQSDNQLWYQDRYGFIRSKLNDFAFDNSGMIVYRFASYTYVI